MNSASATDGRRLGGEIAPTAGGSRRGAARPAPRRNPVLAHLSLDGLREYRAALTAEEGKASYWRRVVQARIEVVNATTDDVPVVDNLGDVIAGVPAQTTRAALHAVVSDGELPDLPDLAAVWLAEAKRGDAAGNALLLSGLVDAEHRLGAYRDALAIRLEAATAELIARYRENPAACLVALPLQPGQPAGA